MTKIPQKPREQFTQQEALAVAKYLGISFKREKFDIVDFTIGMNIELEHGLKFPDTNITDDDPILTGKLALSHLRKFPDYYKRLLLLEDEADTYYEDR